MATRAMSTRSGGGVLVSSDVCGHTQARAHTQAVCSSSRGVGTRQRKPLPLHPLCKHIPFTTGRRARDAKARGSGEGDKQVSELVCARVCVCVSVYTEESFAYYSTMID